MLTTWRVFDHGLDRTFSLFDELRRAMDGVDAPQARDASLRQAWGWPQFSLEDTGDAVLVTADVPGMSPADVDLTLDDGVLTVSGERKVTPPEGFEPQSLERRAIRLSRSFSLPVKVDPEKVKATVKDGVLRVTLAKAPEAQPRRISVDKL